jgi:hypothetical protein
MESPDVEGSMEKQLRWVRRVSYRKAVSSDLNVSLPAQYIVDSPVEKVVTIQRNGWSLYGGIRTRIKAHMVPWGSPKHIGKISIISDWEGDLNLSLNLRFA